MHADGEAIDVNPVENPFIVGGLVEPKAGAAFVDRSKVPPDLSVLHGAALEAFASVGWYRGGRCASSPDYPHISLTGG